MSGPSIYLDYYNNKPISLELKDLRDDGFSFSIIFRIDKLKSNERDNILFSVFNSKGNGFYLYLNKNHILQYATIIPDNKLNISYHFFNIYFLFSLIFFFFFTSTDFPLVDNKWHHLYISHTPKSLWRDTIIVYIYLFI